MLDKLIDISNSPGIGAKLDNILLIGFNIMNIGMIDWVKGIGSILDSFPAMALTLTMVVLNLAKAYQIWVDTRIKKKKELEKEDGK